MKLDLGSELKNRILFGSVLAILAIFCTLYSPMSFYALVLIGALLMYTEWLELTKPFPLLNKFGGLIYVGLPIWSLIALRGLMVDVEQKDELGNVLYHSSQTAAYVIYLFAVVWATDIGAYFAGKSFGKRPLAPSVSPNKTIEGLAGGMACAALVGFFLATWTPYPGSMIGGAILGAVLAIVAQAGDLFESWLKRKADVKDSGTLIPGHGGILDRVDGLVFAAPVYAFLVFI